MAEDLLWRKYIDIIILVLGIFSCFSALVKSDKRIAPIWSIILMVIMVLLLAYFPIGWGMGTDKENYANGFNYWAYNGLDMTLIEKDVIFALYQWFCGLFMDVHGFFVVTALIYVYNHYRFSKIIEDNGYFLFIAFVLSFSFVAYGVNTIRAGLAASLILVALTEREIMWKKYLFLALAVGTHFSMIIPALALIISEHVKNRKIFYWIWVLAIPISFVAGSFFEGLFASMGVDDRVSYLVVSAADTHYNVDFRFDFIIYSALPVLVSYYYTYMMKIEDKFYEILSSAYVLANVFWILVIRANFSDRFAYLSWFLYPVILLYPVLKSNTQINNKSLIVGSILAFLLIFRMLF